MMRRRRSLGGLDDDIRDHIERETEDNIGRGMTPDEARHAALRAFGNVALAKEDTRAVWIPMWVEQLLQDARYGLRMLRRNPAFSAVVILTLAIGIGLNTAVFSVVNAVLVRPLSYASPERLVWIATYDDRVKDELAVAPDVIAWRDQAASIDRLAAFFVGGERITVGDEVVQARMAAVTDGFWDLTGARFALGRPPGPGEEGIVLSHAFFEERCRGDPAVVGRPMSLDARQIVVTGVLQPGSRAQLPPAPAWTGIEPGDIALYRAAIVRPPSPQPGAGVELFNVIGRLKPGVTIERARAELDAVRIRARALNPAELGRRHLLVVPYADKIVGHARAPLLILLAAVALVLLVACANIASLLLARGSARYREIAIRTAVGAGRGRVVRQFLVESFILAAIGGAAGLLLARAGIAIVLRMIPQAVPRLAETTIDGRVLAFAAGATVATTFVFGLAPALTLWKTSLHDLLRDGARTASAAAGSLRVRKALVAIELALSLVLLVGAGLMVRSVWRLTTWPPGFAPDRVLTMRVQFSGPRYRIEGNRRAYIDELLRRAQAAPGVEAAGVSSSGAGRMMLTIEGANVPLAQRPQVLSTSASGGYAGAIGMRVAKGRWLTDAEPALVYIVNEALARQAFPGQDPIGRRILLPWLKSAATIVGVVADLRYGNLDAAPEPELFVDYAHAEPFGMTLVMRTAGDPAAAAPAIRTLLTGVDKTQPIFDVKPLDATLSDSIAPRRFNVLLLGTFAACALLLALVGIYGVIAYSVAQRTHEIGVRMALGAQRREVVWMVVRQGMAIASAGILLGIAAAVAATRVLTSLLYEVTPTDPATFAVVTGLLAATALAACGGPALKAALVDPIVALRCE